MTSILIIDDSPEDLEQLASLLTDEDTSTEVVTCRDGQDALTQVRERTFDCVLLDLRLDGESGLDVLVQLQNLRQTLPVIVLSGQGSEQAAVDAFVTGAAYYLPKQDVTSKTLWTAVSRVIDKAETDRQLKSKSEALERSNRLDAVGQLAAGIAHDFNNQLNALRYCVELINSTRAEKDRQERISNALKIIDDTATLAGRMLSLSRQGNLMAVEVSLASIFSDLDVLAAASLPNEVTLNVRRPSEDLSVFCDPGQLLNALLNLTLNASDATVAKGRKGKVTVSAIREIDQIVILVDDNGTGMSRDVIAKSTDPFFTTKSKTNGTGLGLAMVQAFVTENSGELLIHSEVGKGTQISVVLPAADTKEGAADATTQAPNAAAHTPVGPILIIDDNLELAMMTRDVLAEAGYRVEAARTAEDALDMLAQGLRPCIALTDINMPSMSGFELANKIKEQDPDVGIIYFTGFAQRTEIQSQTLHGPVLQKPVRREELTTTINRLLSAP